MMGNRDKVDAGHPMVVRNTLEREEREITDKNIKLLSSK